MFIVFAARQFHPSTTSPFCVSPCLLRWRYSTYPRLMTRPDVPCLHTSCNELRCSCPQRYIRQQPVCPILLRDSYDEAKWQRTKPISTQCKWMRHKKPTLGTSRTFDKSVRGVEGTTEAAGITKRNRVIAGTQEKMSKFKSNFLGKKQLFKRENVWKFSCDLVSTSRNLWLSVVLHPAFTFAASSVLIATRRSTLVF